VLGARSLAELDSLVADVRVRRDGERWLLRDIGSRNGTRLNGARVTDEVEARPGDQISLGGVRYRLSAR
jgi:hypothetical protein